MIKEFCDVCGAECTKEPPLSEIKIKFENGMAIFQLKPVRNLFSNETMIICNKCLASMMIAHLKQWVTPEPLPADVDQAYREMVPQSSWYVISNPEEERQMAEQHATREIQLAIAKKEKEQNNATT